VPVVFALAGELLGIAAYGDDVEAALLELVDAPVDLAELGSADGAVVAAVEEDQGEALWMLSAEIPPTAADELDAEPGCLLARFDAGTANSDLGAVQGDLLLGCVGEEVEMDYLVHVQERTLHGPMCPSRLQFD
jgi:hypothetical protein